MPTYQYACTECGHAFEQVQSFSDDALTVCPECAGKLRKLFTKQQRAFYEAHAPAGLDIDDLSVLGPILVMKLKWVPEALGRKVVGEMWVYPDGSEIVELSTKCPPAEAFDTAVRTRAFLVDHGIDLAAPQQTKTRTALEFFSAELAANVVRAGQAPT